MYCAHTRDWPYGQSLRTENKRSTRKLRSQPLTVFFGWCYLVGLYITQAHFYVLRWGRSQLKAKSDPIMFFQLVLLVSICKNPPLILLVLYVRYWILLVFYVRYWILLVWYVRYWILLCCLYYSQSVHFVHCHVVSTLLIRISIWSIISSHLMNLRLCRRNWQGHYAVHLAFV